MPKAILEYHLPDERNEFELATKAEKMWQVLSDLRHDMRAYLKYDKTVSAAEMLDAFYATLCLEMDRMEGE